MDWDLGLLTAANAVLDIMWTVWLSTHSRTSQIKLGWFFFFYHEHQVIENKQFLSRACECFPLF